MVISSNNIRDVLRFQAEITGIIFAILVSAFLQIEKDIMGTEMYTLYLFGLAISGLSFLIAYIDFIICNRISKLYFCLV